MEETFTPQTETKKKSYYTPKVRIPEEENFWLNATKGAKENKVLSLVNTALKGDLHFESYEVYRFWIKNALTQVN